MAPRERQTIDSNLGAQSGHPRHRTAVFASEYPLVMFCILAYVLSWSVFLPVVIFRASPRFFILATFGPFLAAVITSTLAGGNYRWLLNAATWRRTLAGTAAGVSLIILAYVVLPAISTAPLSRLNWRVLISINVYNYSTFLGGPLGEEPGWRGFALPRLEERYGPIRGTLLLALLWTGWHLPLFIRPGWESAPLWIYLLIMTGLCLIMTFAANLTRFSVITAIIIHAAFNTSSRFLGGLFERAQPVTSLPLELVLALYGLGVGLIVIVLTRGRLAYFPPCRST